MEEHMGTQEKIDRLFALEKIERKDLEILHPLEISFFMTTIQEQLEATWGEERDKFAAKVHDIIDHDLLYDMNHGRIMRFTKAHLNEHGSMPSYNDVSDTVGLSRETVARHMKEFNSPRRAGERDDQFEAVVYEVTGLISKKALAGDMKAAKLVADIDHRKKRLAAMNLHQRTYAMINKTVINWQVIERLKPEEADSIEKTIQEAWTRPGWGEWNWPGGQQGHKEWKVGVM